MAERIHIPEVIEPDEKLPRDLLALRRFARLMDQAFEIPHTGRRFGLDAVLGLIPGVGDTVGALMSTWIIAGALRHRVRPWIIVRMVANVVADLLVGAVPLAGDVFDFLFDSNMRNMRLLETHRDRRRQPRPAWRIALTVAVIAAVIVLIPLTLLVWLAFVALSAAGRLG